MANRWITGIATAGLAAGVLVARPTSAGAEASPRRCGDPYAGYVGEWSNPAVVPKGSPILDGRHLAVPVGASLQHPGLDGDHDGTDDTVALALGTLTITRGDGAVVLTGVPDGVALPDPITSTDLDGDGGDDLVLVSTAPADQSGDPTRWVVSSRLAVGSHTFADGTLPFRGEVVGDATGDGIADLEVDTASIGGEQMAQALPFWMDLAHTDLAPGPAPWPGTRTMMAAADLDFDGEIDRVYHRWSDTPTGLSHDGIAFSDGTDPLKPLAGDESARGGELVRVDTRTYLLEYDAIDVNGGHYQVVTVRKIVSACTRPWMADLTHHLFGREPIHDDYYGWPTTPAQQNLTAPGADPNAWARRRAVDHLATTPEARTHLVQERYRWVLGRSGDPGGVAYWARALTNHTRTPEQLTASLLASNEFFRKAGGTDGAWVDAVFQQQLGRGPDPTGRTYWIAKVASVGRERAARLFLSSTGTRRERVRDLYDALLDRAPTADELTKGIAIIGTDGEDGFTIRLASADGTYLRAQQVWRHLPA